MKFESDAFEFSFGKAILEEMAVFDWVLKKINQLPISENPKFDYDHDSASTFYLRFSLPQEEPKRTMPLDIHFEGDGMHIDMFYQSEVKDWSIEELRSSDEQFSRFITDFLTCYIVKETSSSFFGGNRLFLYDQDGKFVRKFVLSGSNRFFSNKHCERELYFPIFPDEKP